MSRPRLTYANVAATLALVLALGLGGAYAADKIGTNDIKPNAITSGLVRNNALTGKDVREAKLAAVPKAKTVGGIRIKPVSVAMDTGDPGVTLAAVSGTAATAICSGGEVGVRITRPSQGDPPIQGKYETGTDLDLYSLGGGGSITVTDNDIAVVVTIRPPGRTIQIELTGYETGGEPGLADCFLDGTLSTFKR